MMSSHNDEPSRTDSFVQPGAFSNATKLAARNILGPLCWVCASWPQDLCHVIREEDTQWELWVDHGLSNFSVGSISNAIPLCETCRVQFNETVDPGFVFVPTDLRYFIDYELEDAKNRQKERNDGREGRRKVPTADDYKLHQVKQGLITEDSIGGLYQLIFLKNYLVTGIPTEMNAGTCKVKPRHGSPIASLRRAMPILGNPRLGNLDKETILNLERLRDLYFESGYFPSIPRYLTYSHRQPTAHTQEAKRPGSSDPYQQMLAKRPREEEQNHPMVPYQSGLSNHPHESPSEWILGPETSTEEAVRRLVPR